MLVLFDQFYLDPPLTPINSYAVGNSLLHLAVPSDYDRMAALAGDRALRSGRAAILEWSNKQGRPDGLESIALGWPTVLANLKSYSETGLSLPSDVWQMQITTELATAEN